MTTYQDYSTAAMASVFGWESEVLPGDTSDSAGSELRVHVGRPIGGVPVVYTAGVACLGFERGVPSGPELLLAGKLPVTELARGIRAAAATLILRDLAPTPGSVIRGLVADLGWDAKTARHGFFAPPMFWGAECDNVEVHAGRERIFTIVPALLVLVTDSELDVFQRRGWDAFDELMGASGADVLDLGR